MQNKAVSIILYLLGVSIITSCSHHRMNNQQRQIADMLNDITTDLLVNHIGESGFGGKVFCAHKVLDIEITDDNNVVNEYVLADCQEYSMIDGKLEKGTGRRLPVALSFSRIDGKYKLIRYQTPRDGSRNEYDIQHIFPKEIQQDIFNSGTDDTLSVKVEQEARSFYQQSLRKIE